MTGLRIDRDLCIGCGLCCKSCAAAALTLQNRKAVLGEGCTLCGICLQSCPKNALSIVKEESLVFDLTAYQDIWVVCERSQSGELLPVSFELLGKASELAKLRGCRLGAVLLGQDEMASQARQLIAAGADLVYLCQDQRFAEQLEPAFYTMICDLIREYRPEVVLFGATDFGRSVAPRVAARQRTGLTADCTVLEIDPVSGLLQQTRPAFGGNLLATIICPNHRPQMATVRPGILALPCLDFQRSGEVIVCSAPQALPQTLQLLQTEPAAAAASIAEAEIMVVAGRGIGNAKNMKLIYELAELLGAAVGVSRPLVDAGWAEYAHQVGQTGFTVAPKLMLSFGVSGAIQHLAGISRSECIIAVNNDPQAPIFAISHYGLIADCTEVLQELLRALKK